MVTHLSATLYTVMTHSPAYTLTTSDTGVHHPGSLIFSQLSGQILKDHVIHMFVCLTGFTMCQELFFAHLTGVQTQQVVT